MKILLLLVTLTVIEAQAVLRSVTLTWTDTANPIGVTYSIYRANGPCTSNATFIQISTVNPPTPTAITPRTYTDPSIPPGTYCFRVTAVVGGSESAPSNLAPAQVGAFPPVALNVVVQ